MLLSLALATTLQTTTSIPLQDPTNIRPSSRLLLTAAGPDPQYDLDEEWLVYFRQESAEGPAGTDLNGDGDTDDAVLATYQFATDSFTQTTLAGTELKLGDGFVVVSTDEASLSTDLNTDGDLDDRALAILDLRTNQRRFVVAPVVELEAAAGALFTYRTLENGASRLYLYSRATQQSVELPANATSWLAARGALYRAEESIAGVDLNGDGDAIDTLTRFTASDQTTVYTPMISSGNHIWQGGRYFLFLFRESVANFDYNADGDDHDVILHTMDTETGVETILGIGRLTLNGLGKNLTVFFQSETLGGDLNGDGDAIDNVMVSLDHATGAIATSGLTLEEVNSSFALNERGNASVLLFVDEGMSDLNGNGLIGDSVPHYWDLGTNVVWNTGGTATAQFRPAAGDQRALWTTRESDIGVDVTGDGAVTMDPVLASYIPGALPRYVGAFPGRVETPSSGLRRGMLYHVNEATQGRDLNGDGDAVDDVLHLLGTGARRAFSLGHGSDQIAVRGRRFVGFLRESNEQRDVNLDGDMDDMIPFVGSF